MKVSFHVPWVAVILAAGRAGLILLAGQVAVCGLLATGSARALWAQAPEKEITNSIGMKLILIPPGEFMMGSPPSEDARGQDEQQHRVRITRPFYLGVHEVTVGEFGKFVEATKYVTAAESAPTNKQAAVAWDENSGQFHQDLRFNWKRPGHEQTEEFPVVDVNQDDALAFCKWLAAKEGKRYRLPTEAEWEYACRAGTTTAYSFGDKISPDDARISKVFADARSPAKVGSYKPNAFGLYDMHGNVEEWCADFYDAKYYATSPPADPPGPGFGTLGVHRGGTWGLDWQPARSAKRSFLNPTAKSCLLGFRVAFSP